MKVGDLVRPRPDGEKNIYSSIGVIILEVWGNEDANVTRSRIFRVQWIQDYDSLVKQWWREDDLELISEGQ